MYINVFVSYFHSVKIFSILQNSFLNFIFIEKLFQTVTEFMFLLVPTVFFITLSACVFVIAFDSHGTHSLLYHM